MRKKLIVLLCLLGSASLSFGIAGKNIINYAPLIGWSLGTALFLVAFIFAIKSQ